MSKQTLQRQRWKHIASYIWACRDCEMDAETEAEKIEIIENMYKNLENWYKLSAKEDKRSEFAKAFKIDQ